MLLLSLACERLRAALPRLSEAVLCGKLSAATLSGMEILETLERPRGEDVERVISAGHLVGRALLALGREAEAEELFQQQLRVYESSSRSSVRWHASLDQGAMSLALNRGARAVEAFSIVADDQTAPPALRVEALAGLAVALARYREDEMVPKILIAAERVAEMNGLEGMACIVDAIQLEARVLRWLRDFAEVEAGAMPGSIESVELLGRVSAMREQLRVARARLASAPLAQRRLSFLETLLRDDVGTPAGVGAINEQIRALHEDRAVEFETMSRLDAARTLLSHGEAKGARDVLGSLVFDERSACRHRHSLELRLCLSRMHALSGRLGDALRLYKDYARQAVALYGSERPRLPVLRVVEGVGREQECDAAKMRLPLRYRRAYQFIVDHLTDPNLSVRQVAAQIDVTERALQMAFRTHLGVTPAELIRERRMNRIRDELVNSSQRGSVVEVASRWGVRNRSTLAHAYRRQFDETPSATLRG
jgi:AraC-like DNA-binding protein